MPSKKKEKAVDAVRILFTERNVKIPRTVYDEVLTIARVNERSWRRMAAILLAFGVEEYNKQHKK